MSKKLPVNKNIRSNFIKNDKFKYNSDHNTDDSDNSDNENMKRQTRKSRISYYEILNVEEDSTLIEIKEQFRKLVKRFHPDNKESGDAAAFALVAKAYECLSNTNKRSEYDKMLMIEKKIQKSNFMDQKKSFEEFIETQNNDPTGEKKKLATSKFEIDFQNMDRKKLFDRNKYLEEKKNPLDIEQSKKRLDDLLLVRENDDSEIVHTDIFKGKSFNPKKFNKIFEMKFNSSNEIEKFTGNPSAFNEIGGFSDVNYDKNYDDILDKDEDEDEDDDYDSNNFVSVKHLNSRDGIITDDDLNNLKNYKGSHYKEYKNHKKNKGSFEDEINRRMKGREEENSFYENRSLSDYNTNMKDGYGFIDKIGMNVGELDWDDDVDSKTMQQLIEFRKLEDKKLYKNYKK